ncbi:uncharacterized protein LOC113244531 [Ursus arctos]|uniref:uncharacterized protein LOC113244531 n=1 Tax=Ursus arctos TaxID=9644 RepID=UPI0004E00D3B|nr:uncharacterized protein LOC113244531 [Ursus arctos]
MPQLARSHPPVPVSGLPSRTAWPRGQEAEAHPVASQESLPGLPLTVLVSPTPALGGAVHSRGEAVQGGFTQEPQPKGSPWRTGQLVTAPVLAGQAAKDADERPRRCPLCRRSCERSVKGDKPPPRTGALIQNFPDCGKKQMAPQQGAARKENEDTNSIYKKDRIPWNRCNREDGDFLEDRSARRKADRPSTPSLWAQGHKGPVAISGSAPRRSHCK